MIIEYNLHGLTLYIRQTNDQMFILNKRKLFIFGKEEQNDTHMNGQYITPINDLYYFIY